MASTIQLNNTMQWAQTFLGFAPLNIGAANEPAVTSANIILQTILSPPFKWRWNRNQLSFATNTVSVTQDYVKSAPDFGFIENAYLAGGGNPIQLQTNQVLAVDTNSDRPAEIAPIVEDGSGNITFRLMPAPPITPGYTVNVVYQKCAPVMNALASTWTPIPDYLSYIYSWGFLSLMYEYFGNPRAASSRQAFVGSLLAASEGLSEEDKDMFYQAWVGKSFGDLRDQLTVQLGDRARGV
jgi:hypothetical protein